MGDFDNTVFRIQNWRTKESDLITGIEYILFADKKKR